MTLKVGWLFIVKEALELAVVIWSALEINFLEKIQDWKAISVIFAKFQDLSLQIADLRDILSKLILKFGFKLWNKC